MVLDLMIQSRRATRQTVIPREKANHKIKKSGEKEGRRSVMKGPRDRKSSEEKSGEGLSEVPYKDLKSGNSSDDWLGEGVVGESKAHPGKGER